MGGVSMTPDEIERALRRQFPNLRDDRIDAALGRVRGGADGEEDEALRALITFPLRFSLPWSALCSDNEREVATLYMVHGKPAPRKVLSARAKLAMQKTREKAREAIGTGLVMPAAVPLQLVARVWVPDNRQTNDVANFAKCCHDALQKLVYVNDYWLHRVTWERAGVDTDAPRAELEIKPL